MEKWREELYHSEFYNELYLEHHGILGQKWGVRRYQNPDGTLTAAGRKRVNKLTKKMAKKAVSIRASKDVLDYAYPDYENKWNNDGPLVRNMIRIMESDLHMYKHYEDKVKKLISNLDNNPRLLTKEEKERKTIFSMNPYTKKMG